MGISSIFIHFSRPIFHLFQIVPRPVDTARNPCFRSLEKGRLGRFENEKTSVKCGLGRFEAKIPPLALPGGESFPAVAANARAPLPPFAYFAYFAVDHLPFPRIPRFKLSPFRVVWVCFAVDHPVLRFRYLM